jgi:hypothetical protein
MTSTLLPEAQAAALQSVKQQVVDLNANLKINYLSAFNDWLVNWTAGRNTDKSTAPIPPKAFEVGYFNDPTTGPGSLGPYGDTVIQWPYPKVSLTSFVCDMPVIPAQPVAYVPPDPNAPPPGMLGQKADARNPAVDGFPVGYQSTRVDGSIWQKFVAAEPFGTTWYWECIKAGTN